MGVTLEAIYLQSFLHPYIYFVTSFTSDLVDSDNDNDTLYNQ